MDEIQKIIDFISGLERGTITISVSKKISFKDFETETFKILPNSSVEIDKKEKDREVRKRLAFAKFRDVFTSTLKEYEAYQNYFIKINHTLNDEVTICVIQYINGGYFDLPLKDNVDSVTNTTSGLFESYGVESMTTKNVLETPEFKIFVLSILTVYALIAFYLFVSQIFALLVLSFFLGLLCLGCLVSIIYRGFIKKDFKFLE